MIVQHAMPAEPRWLHPAVPPDLAGFPGLTPWRDRPAVAQAGLNTSVITVVGTLRDEAVAVERSFAIWSRQIVPDWLRGRVEFLFCDDGSSDHPLDLVRTWSDAGHRVRYLRFRDPGDPADRSCTLLLNAAIRRFIESPLVLVQWWDRIPGSFHHLTALLRPHVDLSGIATSAVSRHIGGSSSVEEMSAEQLAAMLATVNWRDDPALLERIAGQIGGHCVPGLASESSGLCLTVDDFVAIGGYDERYRERAGYANVELFRRLMESGVPVHFASDWRGQNFHQSHRANRVKDRGWLHDPAVVRNRGMEWGDAPVVEVWPA